MRDAGGPAALREAFGDIAAAVAPIAAEGDDVALLTETYWARLYGRGGRLPEAAHAPGPQLLIGHFAAQVT
ncbi:hypothetical protein [Streptomyces sp. NPDC051677]|uniref:hypothetical protein n=1 Tax=Streptomyces sp. NPDC051677 TaxID=3365669 RepID=UPI0037D1300F